MSQTNNPGNPPVKPPVKDPPPDPGGNGAGFELKPTGPITQRTPSGAPGESNEE